MALNEDGSAAVTTAETEVVYNAIVQAIFLEAQRNPSDNITSVGAHLIAVQTPYRGRHTVHQALIALREQGRISVNRKGKNPRVDEFSLVVK